MEQLMDRLGMAASIDRRVQVLKRRLPYQESDHVLNLLYNVVSGGNCLQDLEERRNDLNYLDALGAEKWISPLQLSPGRAEEYSHELFSRHTRRVSLLAQPRVADLLKRVISPW